MEPWDEIIALLKKGQNILLTGGAGCLAVDTGVIMSDGSVKKVQDIKVSDLVMGPDSRPRKVTKLYRGKEKMLKVESKKGDSYICNRSHIHSFYCSFDKCGFKRGEIYDMTYEDFLKIPKSAQKALKTIRASIDLPEKETEFDPRVLGIWLGDGCSSNTSFCINKADKALLDYVKSKMGKDFNIPLYKNEKPNALTFAVSKKGGIKNPFKRFLLSSCIKNNEKTIPKNYLLNSRKKRLDLLAGIIDTDGHKAGACTFEIVQKSNQLTKDILFLAKSLGFMATSRKKTGTIKSLNFSGEYNRIFISGDFSDLKLIVKRKISTKRAINKNPLVQGFSIRELKEDLYFGFELEGPDKRFLLSNFIVTHNTGKSYSLRKVLEWADEENWNVARTAMTGMASLQLELGETLHRALGIGFAKNRDDLRMVLRSYKFRTEVRWELQALDLLVVDEVSMLRSDLLELCDEVLKQARGNRDPFGGLQIIFSGDFMQLSPVVKNDEKEYFKKRGFWAFQSDVWESLNLKVFYLTEIKRQDDKKFSLALNMIRAGAINEAVDEYFFNTHKNEFPEGVEPVRLLGTNTEVDRVNENRLKKITGEPMVYQAKITGISDKAKDKIVRDCPGVETLKLKPGAQVMVLINDRGGRFVNGSMGEFKSILKMEVIDFDGEARKVDCAEVELFDSGETVFFPRYEWKNEKKEEDSISGKITKTKLAGFEQFPLRLGWAITIHKSQGMSLDYLQVDLTRCFAEGMAYVALSRARKYEGLNILNWRPGIVTCNKDAFKFYMDLKEKGEI